MLPAEQTTAMAIARKAASESVSRMSFTSGTISSHCAHARAKGKARHDQSPPRAHLQVAHGLARLLDARNSDGNGPPEEAALPISQKLLTARSTRWRRNTKRKKRRRRTIRCRAERMFRPRCPHRSTCSCSGWQTAAGCERRRRIPLRSSSSSSPATKYFTYTVQPPWQPTLAHAHTDRASSERHHDSGVDDDATALAHEEEVCEPRDPRDQAGDDEHGVCLSITRPFSKLVHRHGAGAAAAAWRTHRAKIRRPVRSPRTGGGVRGSSTDGFRCARIKQADPRLQYIRARWSTTRARARARDDKRTDRGDAVDKLGRRRRQA